MLKIKDNRNNKTRVFGDLEAGAVFCFCETFYMKINRIVNNDDDDNCYWSNAISLKSGNITTFDNSDEVDVCCNAELVIND